QPAQQRMAAGRLVFEPQIGVLHSRLDAPAKIHSEQLGQAEVLSPGSPFVAQAGLVRGNHAAAAGNEVAELPALRVGQCGDVRKDERLELAEMRRVEQPVMRHLEWNPRLD